MKKTALMIIFIIALSINILPASADSPYYIKVNRQTNCVTVFDSSDKPVRAMICSVGKDVGGGSTTPTGTYSTSEKMRWHALFENEYGQYCTRIVGHILFHSVPYFSENENDLNTANYNMLGEKDSLGCVRLKVEDAKWIYDNCPIGTRVTIFDGNAEDDPLGKPRAIKLGAGAQYPKWDPTDPSENNPWQFMTPSIEIENNVRSIYENSYLSGDALTDFLKEGVKAYDTAGNLIDFTVETDVNPVKSGSYTITYKAADALGRSAEAKATFVVLPSGLILDASIK